MSAVSERKQGDLVKKLKTMGFSGPQEIAGKKFMIYHGTAFAIPNQPSFTITQFRFLLKELEKMISPEEWDR